MRPTWPETWMAIAHVISARSYDPRLKVGAIIVSADNTQMLAGGYNGNYAGGPHEHESPEPGQSGFIHAETNALIERVVYDERYRDPGPIELLHDAGVEVMSLQAAISKAQAR